MNWRLHGRSSRPTRTSFTARSASYAGLLVSIYRQGEPDAAALLLEADGLDELAATKSYLDHMQDYEAEVVNRVRALRTESRDAVATIEASIERMEVARAAIEERQAGSRRLPRSARGARGSAQRRAGRAPRGAQQAEGQGGQPRRSALDAGSDDRPRHRGDLDCAPSEPVAPPNGSTATINSDGTATAPADAPQAVKDAIAAGNQITNSPYLYGGGHGSFDSPGGYDCSGSVSYALHGGGLLSTPLDSTGFMTWGDPGPGQWITIYSNPATHTWSSRAFASIPLARRRVTSRQPHGARPGSSPRTRPATRSTTQSHV